MVEVKISNTQVIAAVKNLLSLCSVPMSDDGTILICDQEAASEICSPSKSGVIVIGTDGTYQASHTHCDLSGMYGQKYSYFKYPFSYADFIAAVYRLSGSVQSEQYVAQHSTLVLSQNNCTVSYGGNTVSLSHREMDLLISLYRRVGDAIPREVLKEEVWGDAAEDGTNIVDVYISYLRKKLTPVLGDGFIVNKRNQGYMLILPRD